MAGYTQFKRNKLLDQKTQRISVPTELIGFMTAALEHYRKMNSGISHNDKIDFLIERLRGFGGGVWPPK